MQKVRQYFENTSLHGPKYITEYGRHFVEKIFWIIVVIAATFLGVYLTIRIVNKWNQTPILTSISTTNYPLNQIPFPAVTICPNTKGLRGKIVHEICRQNWTSIVDPDQVLLGLYNTISPVLGTDLDLDNPKVDLGLNITETISFLKRVSPKCSDFLLHCTWNSVKYNCNQLFKVASTDMGFCCSFNLVPPSQILSSVGASDNVEDDYEDDDEEEDDEFDYGNTNQNYDDVSVEDYAAMTSSCYNWLTHLLINGTQEEWQGTCREVHKTSTHQSNKTNVVFKPKYIAGHGLDHGLSILIDTLVCELLSTDFFDGLKVYVHNSDTFPEVGQRGFIINKGTVNYVALKAYITESSVDTRRYSNLTRGCNFADERQLRYYKNYTRANCELESKIDAFQENCGCKPYYFPGDLVICDRVGMQCIHRNQNINTSYQQCLPLCTEVSYETSLSVAEFPGSESLLLNSDRLKDLHENLPKKMSYDYFLRNMVSLKIFFPENSAKAYQRDELYSPEDLIANIGGTLGLCLGFSLVSLVELFYFLTLRWIFEGRKSSKKF